MLTIDDATALIKKHLPTRKVVELAVEDCRGLYLAEEVLAPENSPRYTNSAMDGFALNWCSIKEGQPDYSYKIVGESQAGIPFTGTLKDGEVIRINTGAAVPASADTVIRVEDTEESDSSLKINTFPSVKGQNVRYQGEEFRQGQILLDKGSCLHAPQIALLTAVGITRVLVYRPCEVTLIVTGSELVAAGDSIGEYQIRDSNMAMLLAAVADAGGRVVKSIRVPDDQKQTEAAISEAATDIVLCTGGVSVGKHDHVKSAAIHNGYEEIFWRIRQKPGKPLFFARKNDSLLFGLPGNPVSAFMCFIHYIKPLIGYLSGLNFGWPVVAATVTTDIKSKVKRPCMVRVKLFWHPNSGYSITDAVAQGSHMLTSISESDGYIILEPGQLLAEGETIDVYCYHSLKEII